MNAAQLRSLPVQAALTAGLFLGCFVLAGIIISQRWRFESFVRETYSAPGRDLSDAARSVTSDLLAARPASELWNDVPAIERRAVYYALMRQTETPTASFVTACVETDAAFFVMCAERTVVCGDAAQRRNGLKFLELCGANQAASALDRLAAWAERRNRPDELAVIDEARQRLRRGLRFQPVEKEG